MKLSAHEEYGLRCLLRLARAYGEQPLTIPEVAAAENLSAPYVAKLLSVLRQAGLIDSVRGRTGGYHLAQPPSTVRLGAVLLALGEPLFEDPGYCERHAGPETKGPCVHQESCSLRALWQALDQWMRHVLDRVTLADLLENESQIGDRLRVGLQPSAEPTGAAADVRKGAPLLTLAPLSRE